MKQRAGYLLQFLCGWAETSVYHRFRPVVEQLDRETAGRTIQAPFFHADRPAGHDLIAKYRGLSRGMDVARLRKLITPPYIV